MKMIIARTSEKSKRMTKRRGENVNLLAKQGAKGLGRILRFKSDPKEEHHIQTKDSYLINSLTPRDDIQEISIRKIGKGEMFGQNELINDLGKYSATLKCTSLTAEVYQITKQVLSIWYIQEHI